MIFFRSSERGADPFGELDMRRDALFELREQRPNGFAQRFETFRHKLKDECALQALDLWTRRYAYSGHC